MSKTKQQVEEQLFNFMTTGTPSKSGNAMHSGVSGSQFVGGSGNVTPARNALARKVAQSVADLYPAGVSDADYNKIQDHLETQLTVKGRTEFAASFGAPEEVGAREDLAKQKAFAEVVAKGSGVTLPVLAQVEEEKQAVHLALKQFLSDNKVSDYRGVSAKLMTQPLNALGVARAVHPTEFQLLAEDAQKRSDMEALKNIRRDNFDNYAAAVGRLALGADAEVVWAIKVGEAIASSTAIQASLAGGHIDEDVLGRILGTLQTENAKYACLESLRQQVIKTHGAKHDAIAQIEEVMSTNRLSADKNGQAMQGAQGALVNIEKTVTAYKSDTPELQAAREKIQAASQQYEAALGKVQQESQAKRDAASRPTAEQVRVQEHAASVQRARARSDTAKQQAQQQRDFAEQQAQQQRALEAQQRNEAAQRELISQTRAREFTSLVDNVGAARKFAVQVRAHEEAAEKAKMPINLTAFPVDYNPTKEVKDRAIGQYVDTLLSAKTLTFDDHDTILQRAPREFQKEVLQALKNSPNLQSHPSKEAIQKWGMEREIAVDNNVTFDPSSRTPTEHLFMQAEMTRLDAQAKKEKAEEGMSTTARAAASILRNTPEQKTFKEAEQRAKRAKEALTLEQEQRAKGAAALTSSPSVSAQKTPEQRLAEASEQKASRVSHMARYEEQQEGIRKKYIGRGVFDTPQDRIDHARAQREFAEQMADDVGAMSGDLAEKSRGMQKSRHDIAVLNPKTPANVEAIRARAVQLVIESGKPPFHANMTQEQEKAFADAVGEKVKTETAKLASVQTELNAKSLLSADAITKMERAHKDMLTFSHSELDRVRNEWSVNESLNNDLALRKNLLDKGLGKLDEEEKVKLASATVRLAYAGMFHDPQGKDDKQYNKSLCDTMFAALPEHEKDNARNFASRYDIGVLAAQHQDMQKEYEALLSEKDQAKKAGKSLEDEKLSRISTLEQGLVGNRQRYEEQISTLNQRLAVQHEQVVDAVEKQKEVATFSGKFQAFVNDVAKRFGAKNGPFAEGDKVLNARKLQELESRQEKLAQQMGGVARLMDQHRDSYLDAKKKYEDAKTKVDEQLQSANTSLDEFTKAHNAVKQRSDDPKVQQAQAAMVMLEKRDKSRAAAVSRVGGQRRLEGDIDRIFSGAQAGMKGPLPTSRSSRSPEPQEPKTVTGKNVSAGTGTSRGGWRR